MIKSYLLIASSLLLILSCASKESTLLPDQIAAEKTPITVKPIMHGTLALEWNGKTIYVDPYGGPAGFEGLSTPNLVLITDIHGDHMNIKTLDALELNNATFIAPKAVYDELPEAYKTQTKVLANGESLNWEDISVEAIAMYNMPNLNDARHPKGRGNGYVLTMGGKTIYISGDTEDIPEMRSLKNIDLAFVCMNLPYTMTVEAAADGVLAFGPKVVYPYHYRGTEGLSDTGKFKTLVSETNPDIDVRLRNWYN